METLEGGGKCGGGGGGEIDTSAPFESVKEAVTKFGGLGFWKPLPSFNPNSSPPSPSQLLLSGDVEEVDVARVEEQAAQLVQELKVKERDTLEVLKELESTKLMVEELRSTLQNYEATAKLNINDNTDREEEEMKEDEKENNPYISFQKCDVLASAPSAVLMELKQAKWNLTKTTNDLAEIRASVESYNKKVERERTALEKTRQRLKSNTSKISSLEDEITQTKSMLQESDNATAEDVVLKLQQLGMEVEKYKKIGEEAKAESMKVMAEIEQTKAKVKTAEIRLVAARKMKEAARAAESVALGEIKALELGVRDDNTEKITLTCAEYSSLKRKACDAEQASNVKVLEALHRVDEENVVKGNLMMRVEEAMEEVKISKRDLEAALARAEAADRSKLAMEEALRKWRSDKRSITQNNTKFKNPCPASRSRRDSKMLDVNGITLAGEGESTTTTPVLRSNLSIGQILSNKLLITQEFESGKSCGKSKVSLGQMLGKPNLKMEKDGRNPKEIAVKRNKFARFSVLLPKKSQKKKKPTNVVR